MSWDAKMKKTLAKQKEILNIKKFLIYIHRATKNRLGGDCGETKSGFSYIYMVGWIVGKSPHQLQIDQLHMEEMSSYR